MFFVISGYTIFNQLFESGYSLKHFLLMRISRISIPYFPVIILLFLFVNLGGKQFVNWAIRLNESEVSFTHLLLHFSYLASFDYRYANSIIGVEWSLNAEVFFYLVIGFLISKKLIKLSSFNLFLWLLLTGGVGIVILGLGYASILDELSIQWLPFRYGWMFILGGISFLYRNKIQNFFQRELLIIFPICQCYRRFQ